MTENILTFCTAEIPPELISQFIKHSQRTQESSKIWSIVRTPTSHPLGKRTRTTISPFRSGFLDASLSTLSEFVTSAPQTDGHHFSRNTFAVLDARSIEDETVVLWSRLDSMPMEAVERGGWDEGKKTTEWKDYRVEFSKACWVVGVLQTAPGLFGEIVEKGQGTSVDGDGVLKVDTPMKECDLEVDDVSTDEESL
ncbi:uncharacterized protein EAE97_011341 [Botrytis byssoidea]|uniref:Uncharacterized protein n=1 Tax=Botrytis byssoidea TaxID=139641 RepID=A0A9P5HVZ0_9HELO|nr:uncharacterized protein EAE97_011341 [Botrytis byssoidea]KAF7921073.1 hypothetical protein EAE97_011341 [Botrytis byssoidea]